MIPWDYLAVFSVGIVFGATIVGAWIIKIIEKVSISRQPKKQSQRRNKAT